MAAPFEVSSWYFHVAASHSLIVAEPVSIE